MRERKTLAKGKLDLRNQVRQKYEQEKELYSSINHETAFFKSSLNRNHVSINLKCYGSA